jgi:hypothetical protein
MISVAQHVAAVPTASGMRPDVRWRSDRTNAMDPDLRRLISSLENVLMMKPDTALIPVVARDLRALLAALKRTSDPAETKDA